MNSTSKTPRIAITPGEPAGIGPDLCVQLAQQAHSAQWVAIGDPALLQARAEMLQLPLRLETFDPDATAKPQAAGSINVLPVPLAKHSVPGELNVNNADYVLECLRQAVDGCVQQRFAAMVTGPVHKGVINDAGREFTGHTEFLAERCGARRPVMMLQTDGLRVALATTHLPLRDVADAISATMLTEVIEILHNDLRQFMGIEQPVIYVCGLNPHAGEGGHLGSEEQRIIEPVLFGGWLSDSITVLHANDTVAEVGHVSRSRPAGIKTPGIWRCRERDVGIAHYKNLSGSRHCPGLGRHRPSLGQQFGKSLATGHQHGCS